MSGSNDEYADVPEMFRHLQAFERGTAAFCRQRDTIVERCLPLADHIALRYARRGEPLEDLVQVARLGLVYAVNRYDVDSGSPFLAFAVPTVMGEVRRYFRDHSWALKVPRRCKEIHPKVKRAREELSHELGRAPNVSEIAEHLNVNRDLVVDAMVAASNYSALSTDASVGDHDGDDLSIASSLGDVDPNIDKVLQIETVRSLIPALPETQQKVLALRFFEDMTQTQIAERLGFSQMHVSRLLSKALNRLRTEIRDSELAAAG